MDTQKAAALNNAVARTGHPRNDYRTEEAKRQTRWMLDFATDYISPNDLLVDLGCAAGKQTLQAEELGVRAVGLDCAFEALKLAKTIATEMSSPAEFIRGNYVFTPFASDSVDVVLFPKNLVECSYAEAELLAAEIHRILKPGGRLILTLPDSLMKYTAQSELLSNYNPVTVQWKKEGRWRTTGMDRPSNCWIHRPTWPGKEDHQNPALRAPTTDRPPGSARRYCPKRYALRAL